MTEERKGPRIDISPEPSPEEMAAIASVIAGLTSRQVAFPKEQRDSRFDGRERWAAAGRRDVLRPMDRDDGISG